MYRLNERSMDSITERLLNAKKFRRNRRVVFPEHDFGHDQIFGKRAVRIDAQNFEIVANVHLSREALLAVHARDMRFDRNYIAFIDASDDRTFLYYNAGRLMTHGIGHILDARLRP